MQGGFVAARISPLPGFAADLANQPYYVVQTVCSSEFFVAGNLAGGREWEREVGHAGPATLAWPLFSVRRCDGSGRRNETDVGTIRRFCPGTHFLGEELPQRREACP